MNNIETLYGCKDGPRTLSGLMLKLTDNEWVEIFTNESFIPKHVITHIKKYFKATAKPEFFITITSAGAILKSRNITSETFDMAMTRFEANKAADMDAIRSGMNHGGNVVVPDEADICEAELAEKDVEEELAVVAEEKPLYVAVNEAVRGDVITSIVKANVQTKHGLVTKAFIGIDDKNGFTGVVIYNKVTTFYIDGKNVENVDGNKVIESAFAYMEEIGLVKTEAVSDELTYYALIKAFKNNSSFDSVIGSLDILGIASLNPENKEKVLTQIIHKAIALKVNYEESIELALMLDENMAKEQMKKHSL